MADEPEATITGTDAAVAVGTVAAIAATTSAAKTAFILDMEFSLY
jgi:hypothetical protein